FFAQVQVGGKDDGGTILVDEPGDTHADSADGAGGVMSREFVNGVADHIGEGVAVGGSGVLDPRQDPAVNIDNAGGHLGATDVHADRQPHGRLPFTSCPSSRPSALGLAEWSKPLD